MKALLTACAALVSQAALAERVNTPSLQLRAEERYDDDFRLNEGGAGQLMTKLTPRLGFESKTPTQKVDAFYATDFLYRHGSGVFSIDHRGGLDSTFALSRRLKIDAGGRLFRVTDPTSLPRQGLGRSFSPILYGRGTLGMTGRATGRLDVRAGYAFEGARLYDEARPTGFVHTPSLEGWFKATRRLDLGVEYRYQAFLLGDVKDQAHGGFGALRYRLTRLTTFTARGGPVRYVGQDGMSGLLPRFNVELAREGQLLDVALVAGHDLVGASGLTASLWADYASLVFARHFGQRFQLYGAASYFRNGRPPNEGFTTLGSSPGVSQGYAVGAGVEFRVNRTLTLQGSADRIAQVGVMAVPGAEAPGAATRNVAAVRAILTAW